MDVSVHEAMTASASSFPIGRFSAATQIMRRMGSHTNAAGVNCYPCSDGYAQMNIHFAQLWQKLVEWIDHPVLKDPYWLSTEARSESAEVAEEIIKEFTASMTTEEFVSGGRKRGLPVAPVNTFSDVRCSPVLLGRNWFKDVVHPELGEVSMPGFPWTMSSTPPRYSRTAPLLGEHTEDVLQADGASSRGPASGGERHEGPPLKGVRVIDLTRAWAGPFCTRLLADYGAEVIKIESGKFDTQREGRAGIYTELNRNKMSITIDLHHPEGQGLVKRLAEQSDVLVNNYRPGTLERFNLGYEELRKVNPGIIVLSMPGYGSTGPGRLNASHGAQLMADSVPVLHLGSARHAGGASRAGSNPRFPRRCAGRVGRNGRASCEGRHRSRAGDRDRSAGGARRRAGRGAARLFGQQPRLAAPPATGSSTPRPTTSTPAGDATPTAPSRA